MVIISALPVNVHFSRVLNNNGEEEKVRLLLKAVH